MPIPCMPLKGLWDGPLFGREQGTLSSLQNMEMKAGGYAEARGGMSELQPSGGTAADAISAGGYSGVHQVNTSYGWIRTYDSAAGAGSQYSKNKQFSAGGWAPFPTGVVNDAIYFGSDAEFSRVSVLRSIAGAWVSITIAYEYWNGASWGALTTAETFDLTSTLNAVTAWTHASWTLPTDWVANTVGDAGTGNVLKKWMRARITAVNTLSTNPILAFATGNWTGMREIYEASQSPRGGAANGTLKRHGQTGTTEEWFSISSALFSGSASTTRMASYRGRLFFVNGKDQKRWDGDALTDIGLTPPDSTTITVVPAVAATAGGLTPGTYRYWVAFGYGPPQNHRSDELAQVLDPNPLYGASRAYYPSAEATTTAGNELVNVTLTGTTTSDVSVIYIYRTRNLANVQASQRQMHPAFLIGYMWRNSAGNDIATNFSVSQGSANVFADTDLAGASSELFPQIEATQYDIKPPLGMKYLLVYQNRLLLGDDSTWYWSDPFKPDRFNRYLNYISLAKATGGRHMGGIEFGDQAVLYTEEQTWGLGNIDLDGVPQLFPIHPGVGCIAPDAITARDGVLIAPARDGFYGWDGTGIPKNLSASMDQTFGSMSYETHGGSKAVMHNGRYDIRISTPGFGTVGSAYRFSLEAWQAKLHPWSTIVQAGFSSTLFPLATIIAPLGNADAGAVHSIWGKCDYGTGAGEYGLFLGELTTQDAGSNYSCVGTMHFPLAPNTLFSPSRILAYYQASDGWGTPALAFTPSSNIGSGVGTIGTGTPDTGADYSLIGGTFSEVSRGSSDLQVSFTVSSAASGTVNRQRFFGGILDGTLTGVRRGMV